MRRQIYFFIATILIILSVPSLCNAEYFSVNASYHVCFTPGQDCTQMIVDEIAKAKKQAFVQMYIFTSSKIAKALLDAKRRGVDVKVVLDRGQIGSQYSVAKFFENNGIPVKVDCVKEGIAHNKALMVDGTTTITGSFNYTNSAQKRNIENVVVIKDPIFTKKFLDNWEARYRCSKPIKKAKVISSKKK